MLCTDLMAQFCAQPVKIYGFYTTQIIYWVDKNVNLNDLPAIANYIAKQV